MELIVTLILIIVGYIWGTKNEQRHYRELIQREHVLNAMPTQIGTAAQDLNAQDAFLVVGNVVVASDYFKRFAAGLRNIFGGRMLSYETLLDRGRREAIVRMKEDAKKRGATQVVNVRVETARVMVGAVEVFAYGTALR